MRLAGWILLGSGVGLFTLLTAEGCSSSSSSTAGPCGQRQACLQSPIPTFAETDACNAALADPVCGTQYKAMKDCLISQAVCLANGEVNQSATNSRCSSQTSAYNRCAATRPDGGSPSDACVPRTCAQQNANCGTVDNGCGVQLNCGVCSGQQTCGGGGTPNRCGCAAATCGSPGTVCGVISACGSTLDCGNTCVAPNWCGGAGVANRCGCATTGNTGAHNPTAASTAAITVDAGITTAWSGATGVYTSDNAFASSALSANATTQYLLSVGYGFTLPASATITGIQVEVERSASPGLAAIVDNAVYLVKAPAAIQTAGANLANTGTGWSNTETTVVYGGPTELWGNTWTVADINSAGFGVAFSARYIGASSSDSARIDNIRVTVFFTGVTCQ